MDVLRIIKQVSPHPRRTIRLVAWMNEGNGGAGGRAYTQDYKSELREHLAAIEIGCRDGRPLGLNVSGREFVEGRLDAPKHPARTVHDLYFEPKYEEFRPRTIWSLSNAFTSAFK
jgi:carboxypeptidase Q